MHHPQARSQRCIARIAVCGDEGVAAGIPSHWKAGAARVLAWIRSGGGGGGSGGGSGGGGGGGGGDETALEEASSRLRPPPGYHLPENALAVRNFLLPLLVQSFGDEGALDYCKTYFDVRRFTGTVLKPVCFNWGE